MSEHTRPAPPLFHPFELAFCGPSGAGKTTLITKLLNRFGEHDRVGYVKHDAHRFAMDVPGKDTCRAREAGAAVIHIADPRHHAAIADGAAGLSYRRSLFEDCDFVLLEGYKALPIPKIFVCHAASTGLPEGPVLATVGPDERAPFDAGGLPHFQRDDVEAIARFVQRALRERAPSRVYGLVLGGGRSRRMGRDKIELEYHGRSQAAHVGSLLETVCERVFVSLRADQMLPAGIAPSARLDDRFVDMGPLGGILTALYHDREAAWLVAACDLPLLTGDLLRHLVAERTPTRMATAFRSRSDGRVEPLCAVYEPRSRSRLLAGLADGHLCPRRLLETAPIRLLHARHDDGLLNVNEPAERHAVLARLGQEEPAWT